MFRATAGCRYPAVAKGDGSLSNAKPFLTAFAIEGAPLSDGWAKRTLKFVRPRGVPLEPAAQRFLDFLRKETA